MYSEKSAKSETSNFGLRFLRFLKSNFNKCKKSRFLDFQENVKTYSRTMANTLFACI